MSRLKLSGAALATVAKARMKGSDRIFYMMQVVGGLSSVYKRWVG